jgi:hypothetical protein
MPTLQIHSDAYRLIKGAHRVSYDAAQAVGKATHDSWTGLWEIPCSPLVAREIWEWFDDCEQHSAILPRDAWKVRACRRAKDRIARAT